MASQLSKKQDAVEIRRTNNVLDERVIIRSMALADIQNELQDEIARRRGLEEKLAGFKHLLGCFRRPASQSRDPAKSQGKSIRGAPQCRQCRRVAEQSAYGRDKSGSEKGAAILSVTIRSSAGFCGADQAIA